MSSMWSRISMAACRPDLAPCRSTCVESPVTTILDPKPSRVRNIFICSGVVFCASSRMMNASFRVRPRMYASGAISIFRDYGYRRLRSRARLKFLVADWGVEKFREVLENEYLGRKLLSCDSPPSPTGHRDHVGVHEQKDGKFYLGLAPIAGRISGTTLVELAEVMERYGVAGARLTPYQKIVLIGVEPA